jgi:hypothetical protein
VHTAVTESGEARRTCYWPTRDYRIAALAASPSGGVQPVPPDNPRLRALLVAVGDQFGSPEHGGASGTAPAHAPLTRPAGRLLSAGTQHGWVLKMSSCAQVPPLIRWLNEVMGQAYCTDAGASLPGGPVGNGQLAARLGDLSAPHVRVNE